eukprot:2052963-Amphidinium_carterae.1
MEGWVENARVGKMGVKRLALPGKVAMTSHRAFKIGFQNRVGFGSSCIGILLYLSELAVWCMQNRFVPFLVDQQSQELTKGLNLHNLHALWSYACVDDRRTTQQFYMCDTLIAAALANVPDVVQGVRGSDHHLMDIGLEVQGQEIGRAS